MYKRQVDRPFKKIGTKTSSLFFFFLSHSPISLQALSASFFFLPRELTGQLRLTAAVAAAAALAAAWLSFSFFLTSFQFNSILFQNAQVKVRVEGEEAENFFCFLSVAFGGFKVVAKYRRKVF